jgi:RND family efflux transporter MFP subunit
MRIVSKTLGLLLSSTVLISCTPPAPQPIPPVPVVTGTSSTADVPVYRTYPGKTEAVRTMGINARVDGIMERIHFTQGGIVKPNQMLYSIQDQPFRANLNAAVADLGAALADVEYCRSQLQRNKKLVDEGAISREYYDELETKLSKAQANVEVARSKVVQAELSVEWCNVVMPEVPEQNTYRVGRTFFDEGSLVGPGLNSELAQVIQISPIRALFDPAGSEWPEYLRQSRGGEVPLMVEVSIPTDPDYRRTGRVNFVDNVVDSDTSTVEMWAEIENNDLSLMPGQFVSIKVRLKVLENAVIIPSTCVQSSASEKFVWTMKDGKTPAHTTITLGPEFGDHVVVTKGLESGATIITEGGNKYRPGLQVKVVSSDEMKQINQTPAGGAGKSTGS